MKCSKILSPMTGEAVGLGEVPDPVFSQKIVGDGMAVIPSEGKLLSPVDGEIISVADTKHAYGLRTAEGLELLIHVGLETVHLNGECFQVFVKPGDKVKAGDPSGRGGSGLFKGTRDQSDHTGSGMRWFSGAAVKRCSRSGSGR